MKRAEHIFQRTHRWPYGPCCLKFGMGAILHFILYFFNLERLSKIEFYTNLIIFNLDTLNNFHEQNPLYLPFINKAQQANDASLGNKRDIYSKRDYSLILMQYCITIIAIGFKTIAQSAQMLHPPSFLPYKKTAYQRTNGPTDGPIDRPTD